MAGFIPALYLCSCDYFLLECSSIILTNEILSIHQDSVQMTPTPSSLPASGNITWASHSTGHFVILYRMCVCVRVCVCVFVCVCVSTHVPTL